MRTFHLHLKGQVQGVGIRPYLYRVAQNHSLHGWLSNTSDGVHLEFNWEIFPDLLVSKIIEHMPPHAFVESYEVTEKPLVSFEGFEIRDPDFLTEGVVRISPDMAMCEDCKRELLDKDNRRHEYGFISCTHCGPRYSVINQAPYSREDTEMMPFVMCPDCEEEYADDMDRRFFSQTNSCHICGIKLTLYKQGVPIEEGQRECVDEVVNQIREGKTVVVKAIGGYILLCDATNEHAIRSLREKKQRPNKPLAVLYPNIGEVEHDYLLSQDETLALLGRDAPVVIVSKKQNAKNEVAWQQVSPGLDTYGVILPSAPLLYLIARKVGRPLITTSGNVSGSPTIYDDMEAVRRLTAFADYVLINDREIVVPQDDSVVRYAGHQKIILRRSRGMVPSYFGVLPKDFPNNWLALGAHLKGAFALSSFGQINISQNLGNLEGFDSQQAYLYILEHLSKIFKLKAEHVFTDMHPGFFTHDLVMKYTESRHIHFVQHHRAHFGAVLMENNLLEQKEAVLGVIWDGMGYGDDGQVWGGEFFMYKKGQIERLAHIEKFPQLTGDQMVREPRLTALSLCRHQPTVHRSVFEKFGPRLFDYYLRQFQKPQLMTSSIGRLFDGVASILGLIDVATYGGQAALLLENEAEKFDGQTKPYVFKINQSRIDLQQIVDQIFDDLDSKVSSSEIAFKFHLTLVHLIRSIAEQFHIQKIAFSGGVFQNALLVKMIINQLSDDFKLHFHHQLSPNDENIAFGQLVIGYLNNQYQSKTFLETMMPIEEINRN